MGKERLHTCLPPSEAIAKWLDEYPSRVENYGHLLLEQNTAAAAPVDELRPYFESAHFDARSYFHDEMGIDLHPDADGIGSHARYPNCLPPTTKHGLFGEVLAGLVAQNYALIGEHTWLVPIFLFRFHADVEAYLFALARDPARKRQMFGRFGNDFIGISLADDGSVARLIAGEAKWRNSLTRGVVEELLFGEWVRDNEHPDGRRRSGKGIWHEVNRDIPVPQGVRQLQRLLEEHDPEGFDAAILSMDQALLLNEPAAIPRTDLILMAGNSGKRRKSKEVLVGWEEMPNEYTAGHDLQVVEVYLQNGAELIDELYGSLWQVEAENA